ncbi:hypothetical protein KUTeg_022460 [Tegillarca granosa]|uniref:Phytanoyl-CoA dioxygenase n=1 Tax=Tegillarca granosa TaxID=220873 RepID=A0ABQ9EAV5_TEGGR|nr:hypothetical protein KUTeg_022460 [Tegillarca granosa]
MLHIKALSDSMSLHADYKFTGNEFKFTNGMKKDFDKYGYIILRNVLDKEELENVKKCVENNRELDKNTWGVSDRGGRYVKTALWHSAGDDVAGMVARCEKIVNTAEGVLDGEVYHYYTKYWYQNDILFPDMITVFIAIDRAHKGNGCLQILEGSNNCGRIDHKMVAGQQGDTLFFHGNLLHCSAPNNSQDRRYAFLITYNKATNNPVKEHHFKSYTPLKKVPDSSIRQCTNYNIEDFYDPDVQKTIIPKKFGAEQSG